MARIKWISQRLSDWGRWARQREDGALGYPKQSAFARIGPSSGQGDGVPFSSIDASLTDDAVKSIRFTHPHIHLTLVMHYVHGYEILKVAQRMSRSERTIKSNLEGADHILAAWFTERKAAKAVCR